MSQVLHEIEKKIISSLKINENQTPEQLEESTKLSSDQIRRGIEWLRLKEIINVNETQKIFYRLGKNGLESLENGLPEKRLLQLLFDGPRNITDLQKELGPVFGPSIGLARKNNWIETNNNEISLKNKPDKIPGEKTIEIIQKEKTSIDLLDKTEIEYLQKRPDFLEIGRAHV